MPQGIRILHLEDSLYDAELTGAMLETRGLHCEVTHVKSEPEFEAAVLAGGFDIILSDFALPRYNGLAALSFVRRNSPGTPFIFVSGTMGEELAVESLRNGATDYILKQIPARLIDAILRALEETRERAKRQEAEAALRKSEERFQLAARATNDVIWDWDLQSNQYWCSENFYKLFGYSPGEMDCDIESWKSRIHPDDRERVVSGLSAWNEKTGAQWSAEYRLRRGDGSFADVLDRAYIVHEAGTPVRMIGALMDMTERKKLEAQFLRAQRMETIGALAGGIAHDLNNMLSPILMAVDLLRESQSEENREILEMVGTSAQRGADMVKQILSFARGASGEHGQADIKPVIKDMARLAKDTFPRNILIDCSVTQNLWPVTGNPSQLHQVLLNLAVNARDAMPAGGTLRIEANNVTLNGAISRWKDAPVSGRFVSLSVSDTGVGISPEIMGKLFDPFFTTKDADKGTGLGLSTVMGIVKHHGGFVDVRSVIGSGTTFMVYLPACGSDRADTGEHRVDAPNGHGEEILLVDDEVALVEMTRLMLEAHNYRVMTACDGAAALRLYQQHRRDIQLVVTDLMMPVMDGPETIRQLQRIDPDVKVVVTSGLGSSAYRSSTEGLQVSATLKKPYPAATLLQAIHDVLGNGRACDNAQAVQES